jgi:hypothetical protein
LRLGSCFLQAAARSSFSLPENPVMGILPTTPYTVKPWASRACWLTSQQGGQTMLGKRCWLRNVLLVFRSQQRNPTIFLGSLGHCKGELA